MKRLYRQRGSILAGVCSGIAKYFNIDEIFIRLFFIILFFTSFPIVILYTILWILVPKESIAT